MGADAHFLEAQSLLGEQPSHHPVQHGSAALCHPNSTPFQMCLWHRRYGCQKPGCTAASSKQLSAALDQSRYRDPEPLHEEQLSDSVFFFKIK